MGTFGDSPNVRIVDSLTQALDDVPTGALGVALRGRLVLSPAVLADLIARQTARPDSVVKMRSADDGHVGLVAVGPVERLLDGRGDAATLVADAGQMPFALTGGLEDAREAEWRLARALRSESAEKDAPMARWIDRRLSWRISYRLAHTAVTPNQVTIVSATIGLLGALLFAVPGYWERLVGAVLFLVSTTVDGVDGELARLKMAESRLGARLDTLTDNLVHLALFGAIMTGCYRMSGSSAYLGLAILSEASCASRSRAGAPGRTTAISSGWPSSSDSPGGLRVPARPAGPRGRIGTSRGGRHSARRVRDRPVVGDDETHGGGPAPAATNSKRRIAVLSELGELVRFAPRARKSSLSATGGRPPRASLTRTLLDREDPGWAAPSAGFARALERGRFGGGRRGPLRLNEADEPLSAP